ncbi:hypothetical protein QCE49_24085 [Caballeronia sp. LZ008]|uniref:hypothetical protein n=1 Tax=unclassified Caballeronia TaxID=2646786 RepID=UPI0020277362|nr:MULTISPECIES: hypothetical protein [unclassified Caballeronia]MDR5796469.1 hypothetical protein [Caballeronia sp. LZ008]
MLILSLPLPGTAQALCNQRDASQADKDLWADHQCWDAFYLWQYQAYDMNSDDWANRGWNDACNVNLEYPKHWNAAYLVTYGLADNNDQSFHGTVDYRATAEARSSNFHDHLKHVPTDDTSIFGSYDNGTVATSCLLYNSSSANANPASRAGDFMHEGWHAYFQKYNWDNGSVGGHRAGPQGACTAKGCDYFYFHGIGQYAFGAMWQNDGTANRFHSPNQVQVEFLCDIADQPQTWVPNSVRIAAENDANTRAAERFINGPGYRCGDPRPW